jgi:23S rRNA (guanosine2251-2'-O)-methyltransferase
LAGARPVREVWVADGQDPSPQLDEIERLAARRRARVLLVPRGRLMARARTEAPQGVLALCRPLEELEVDQLVTASPGAPPFLLVLDGVTDPHNVGSLLRSAECSGVTGVVLARHRAAHVTPTVAKVAAGAIEHLRFAVVPGIPSALRRLDELGVATLGLDAGQRRSLYDLPAAATGAVALVLGAEGHGLSALTRRRCTLLAGIPQHGRIPSLNVATAGAVACFELARRRAAASPALRSDPTE